MVNVRFQLAVAGEVTDVDLTRDLKLPFLPPVGMSIYEGDQGESLRFKVIEHDFSLNASFVIVCLVPTWNDENSIGSEMAKKFTDTGKWREIDPLLVYGLTFCPRP